MTTAAVGLFEAKTRLSEYVARAEAGEEVIIMRHNKPVAKIVPLHAVPARAEENIPPYVQRTFNTGVPLVDLTKANQLAAELEDEELIEKMRRIEREYQERHARS
ncbi:type II toxin-antitoxin system prevent-host-death family antitoxin [Ottowia sp.]|uniref:type II toxin-antitoxin system Phd/YefM family antitoxin n=1 Tax=Ottowia sp. TaxID=1898956 RepID=UPI002C034454|nr:type II toxin-antitoxin system prevent-host-death family antitoxin [Ottowia sp.]HOB67457.1 type II toxin-antitoxin system prevent-host-death family antitoxin [Ottowia sp.]HPZ56309.1 type II toxin-antitoxin system prevent-host-death family antitoxin [Ottowia sp.]HQD47552.1 type II toxin-antitoxin system prevent-host-death family antitoxin [Ottowia sp.]